MSFCKHCGAELPAGAKFCKSCGQHVDTSMSQPASSHSPESETDRDSARAYEPCNRPASDHTDGYEPVQSSPSARDRRLPIKKIVGGVIGALVMALGGTGAYNTFFGGDGGGGEKDVTTRPYLPHNILKEESQDADAATEGAEQQEGKYSDPLVEDPKATDYESAYSGTWVSVGLASFPFSDVSELRNIDVASHIDQKMRVSDAAALVVGNGQMKLSLNGKTSLSGSYTISENGIMDITTPSGESGKLWMYATADGVLFCYIYYVDDDGTEMASGIKFRRTGKN